MSRLPRVLSKTGMYHIMARGINRQPLFQEDKDRITFLEILKEAKSFFKAEVYAYCLMDDCFYLFLRENFPGDVKKLMHRALTRYVRKYNYKYRRTGGLIENRYKSEPVKEEDVLALARYIHQAPVRGGVSEKASDWKWSSFRAYTTKQTDGITDANMILDLLSSDRETAVKAFRKWHTEEESREFTLTDSRKKPIAELQRDILALTGIPAEEIADLPKSERNAAIKLLRENGLTIGQMERATGLTRGVIGYAVKEKKQKKSQKKNDMQAYLL